jgi:hypothetical protein
MPARTFWLNFGFIFGATQLYNKCDVMVVVVVFILELNYKVSKMGSSSLCFKVTTCQIHSGQPGQT